jgi:hypothetical protein
VLRSRDEILFEALGEPHTPREAVELPLGLRPQHLMQLGMVVQLRAVEERRVDVDAGAPLFESHGPTEYPRVLSVVIRACVLEVHGPRRGARACERLDHAEEPCEHELGVHPIGAWRSSRKAQPHHRRLILLSERELGVVGEDALESQALLDAFAERASVSDEVSDQIEGRLAGSLADVQAERFVPREVERPRLKMRKVGEIDARVAGVENGGVDTRSAHQLVTADACQLDHLDERSRENDRDTHR